MVLAVLLALIGGGIVIAEDADKEKQKEEMMKMMWLPPFKWDVKTAKNEVELCKVSKDAPMESLIVSPDMRSVACVVTKNGKDAVTVNGIRGKEYDGISRGRITYSPDSSHLAYAASDKGDEFAVIDGAEGERYGAVARPVFSPNSVQVAYLVISRNGCAVVANGKQGKFYGAIGEGPIFSPDSQHVVYVVEENGKSFVVVDGVEQKKYDKVYQGSITFSPDSRRVAYIAKSGDKWLVVADGKEHKAYESNDNYPTMSQPIFSPDSRQVAYSAYHVKDGQRAEAVVVLDGNEVNAEKKYNKNISCITFSADSKRLAYVAGVEKGYVVVVDGLEAEMDIIYAWDLVFSPDSKHLAYLAHRKDKVGTYTAVVLDGAEVDKSQARATGGWIVYSFSLTFTPDSQTLVFVHRVSDEPAKVKTGVPLATGGKPFDEIPVMEVSDNSKYVAYLAKSKDKWLVIVNGTEVGEYTGRVVNSGIKFDSPTKFHTLMMKDDKVVLVEVEMGE
jgi:Tol biopolymer transport system component